MHPDRSRTLAQRMHLDLPLLFGLVFLSALGLVVLYSAGGENPNLVIRQGWRLAFAFALMFLVAQISPRIFFRWAPWLYFAALVLLMAVLLIGDVSQGARRWLSLGPVRFQPSELAKITVPMMVAFHVAGRPLPPSPKRLIVAALVVVVPVLLVARQPDLGTGPCSSPVPACQYSFSPESAGAISGSAESWPRWPLRSCGI